MRHLAGVSRPRTRTGTRRFAVSIVELKHSANQIRDCRRLRIAGGGLQRADRHMENFLDYALGQSIQHLFLFRRELAQSSAEAIGFRLSNRFELILQADDHRYNIARPLPLQVSLYFEIDNALGALRLFSAISQMR